VHRLIDERYRVLKLLGSGGMARVYLAHDETLGQDVALKVLRHRCVDDKDLLERFRREAQNAAALSHPNIVSFYGRGETEDETHYIAMEYVPGGSLKDRILREGALSPDTAAAVALQVAEALWVAHRHGVVHRDVKPHNILLTKSGHAKVTDFGIARAASSTAITRTDFILGTTHYISPEQAMGEPASPKSDLYSLGVVLYEMLTGELPYQAESSIGVVMKHVSGRLRPPKAINANIPEDINAITVRLLARDPACRFEDAAELIDDLAEVGEGILSEATTTRPLDQAVATLPHDSDGRTQKTKPLNVAEMPLSHRAGTGGGHSRGAGKKPPLRGTFDWISWIVAAVLVATLLGIGIGWNLAQNLQDGQTVVVPDVSGQSVRKAYRSLADASLDRAGARRVQAPARAGTVMSTDPVAGSKVASGTPVKLKVSAGPTKKPSADHKKQRKAEG
jgi:serine/threonine protein kinase